MRTFKLFVLFLIAVNVLPAQMITDSVFANYDSYREIALKNRRFKHDDIKKLIFSLDAEGVFEVEELGKSVQEREIYLLKMGSGPINVLFWSQMHGDEATATMALFDLFNFFRDEDEFDSFREMLDSKLTLWFVPMLNPDGAQLFERRNALGVDLNRDALRLQSPEAKILKAIRERSNADFGFNLHDQNRAYSAGMSGSPATISFLAPAYDFEKSVNPKRAEAMKLIALLNRKLQTHIPSQIARYSDDFEPRAFGDNIQKWGTRTILVESGGYKDDRNKQYIRKLNFYLLLAAIESIADGSFKSEELDGYEAIPFNRTRMYDLLIRNGMVEMFGKEYKLDLAVNLTEAPQNEHRDYAFIGRIVDVGDLSTYHGYHEIDADGLKIVPGLVYNEVQKNEDKLDDATLDQWLRQGYTHVRLKRLPANTRFTFLQVNLLGRHTKHENTIELGGLANFTVNQGKSPRFVIMNGQVFDVGLGRHTIRNGMIMRK